MKTSLSFTVRTIPVKTHTKNALNAVLTGLNWAGRCCEKVMSHISMTIGCLFAYVAREMSLSIKYDQTTPT